MKLEKRPIPNNLLCSAACHNENEIQQATKVGVDFILISPVFPTSCFPNRDPLGWKKFSELVKLTSVPAYALGGMTPKDIPIAQFNGGIGIAGTRSLWGNGL